MKRTNKKSEFQRASGLSQYRTLAEIRKCEGTFVPKRAPRVARAGDILTREENVLLRVDLLNVREDFTRKELELAKRALRRMGLAN